MRFQSPGVTHGQPEFETNFVRGGVRLAHPGKDLVTKQRHRFDVWVILDERRAARAAVSEGAPGLPFKQRQRFRLFDRQGLEQHGIHHAEERRIRARVVRTDAECSTGSLVLPVRAHLGETESHCPLGRLPRKRESLAHSIPCLQGLFVHRRRLPCHVWTRGFQQGRKA